MSEQQALRKAHVQPPERGSGEYQEMPSAAGAASGSPTMPTDHRPTGRALCAAAAGRFDVSGCDERFLSRDRFGVIIRPRNVAPGEKSCTIPFDGAKTFYGQTYAISVTQATQYGRAQPGSKRGRG